jgi:hypothetical protein
VAVQHAADVAELDERREGAGGRRLGLAEALAELGREPREPDGGVERGLVGEIHARSIGARELVRRERESAQGGARRLSCTCDAEPVERNQVTTNCSGGTQCSCRRMPSSKRMETSRVPLPTESRTPGVRANAAATASGSRAQAATISTSRTVSQWRRMSPAISARTTPFTRRTAARMRSASARPCGSSTCAPLSLSHAMPRSTCSAVRAPKRGSPASRPSRAASSSSCSVSIPSPSWMRRMRDGPRPGTRIISNRPSGVDSRSRSSRVDSPRFPQLVEDLDHLGGETPPVAPEQLVQRAPLVGRQRPRRVGVRRGDRGILALQLEQGDDLMEEVRGGAGVHPPKMEHGGWRMKGWPPVIRYSSTPACSPSLSINACSCFSVRSISWAAPSTSSRPARMEIATWFR